jgi:hypothetical protein
MVKWILEYLYRLYIGLLGGYVNFKFNTIHILPDGWNHDMACLWVSFDGANCGILCSILEALQKQSVSILPSLVRLWMIWNKMRCCGVRLGRVESSRVGCCGVGSDRIGWSRTGSVRVGRCGVGSEGGRCCGIGGGGVGGVGNSDFMNGCVKWLGVSYSFTKNSFISFYANWDNYKKKRLLASSCLSVTPQPLPSTVHR